MSVSRTRPLRIALISLCLVLASSTARAREIYVVRFLAGSWPTDVPCEGYFWRDHLMFHNSTTQEQHVRLLGVSNGSIRGDSRDLVLPPGRSVSVFGNTAIGGGASGLLDWSPAAAPEPNLFVNRLDVPAGVLVSSRIEVPQSGSLCTPFPTTSLVIFGSAQFPLYASLTSAGNRQYHLGTDLGSNGLGLTADSRLNVGIYNAGSSTANATIELRRSCDDGLIESRSIRVPGNAIIQYTGFKNDTSGYSSSCGMLYPTYAIVTVDQPSFSYVVTLSNERPPKIPMSISQPN